MLSFLAACVHQTVDTVNQHERQGKTTEYASYREQHILECECLDKEYQEAVDEHQCASIFQVCACADTFARRDDSTRLIVVSDKGVEHFSANGCYQQTRQCIHTLGVVKHVNRQSRKECDGEHGIKR